MTNDDTLKIARSLSRAIFRELNRLVEQDRIPSNWGGAELRQYLASKYADETVESMADKRSSRRKNFDRDYAGLPRLSQWPDEDEAVGHNVVTTFPTEFEAKAFAAAHGGVYRGMGWNE